MSGTQKQNVEKIFILRQKTQSIAGYWPVF